jgi:hypothetical protein
MVKEHKIKDVKIDPSRTMATYRDIDKELGKLQIAGSQNMELDADFVNELVDNGV